MVDLERLRHTAYRAGNNPIEGALNDEKIINAAAAELEQARNRIQDLERQRGLMEARIKELESGG